MSQFPLYINPHVRTLLEFRKLVLLSIICSLLAVPTLMVFSSLSSVTGGLVLSLYLFAVGFELMILGMFIAPPTLATVGLMYFLTRDKQKRLERVAFGHLGGYSIGFIVVLFAFAFNEQVVPLVGTAAAGFAVGIFLSFLSKRKPEIPKAALDGRNYPTA